MVDPQEKTPVLEDFPLQELPLPELIDPQLDPTVEEQHILQEAPLNHPEPMDFQHDEIPEYGDIFQAPPLDNLEPMDFQQDDQYLLHEPTPYKPELMDLQPNPILEEPILQERPFDVRELIHYQLDRHPALQQGHHRLQDSAEHNIAEERQNRIQGSEKGTSREGLLKGNLGYVLDPKELPVRQEPTPNLMEQPPIQDKHVLQESHLNNRKQMAPQLDPMPEEQRLREPALNFGEQIHDQLDRDSALQQGHHQCLQDPTEHNIPDERQCDQRAWERLTVEELCKELEESFLQIPDKRPSVRQEPSTNEQEQLHQQDIYYDLQCSHRLHSPLEQINYEEEQDIDEEEQNIGEEEQDIDAVEQDIREEVQNLPQGTARDLIQELIDEILRGFKR